jgi:broad specificity phosphatase PhoE
LIQPPRNGAGSEPAVGNLHCETRNPKSEMPTKVYLVRHGRTDWNDAARIQGHHQTSLNELGRAQARIVAGYLATCGIEFLYSSDLDRARQTAEVIAAATGLTFQTTPALRERDFGPLTGMSIVEARRVRDGRGTAAAVPPRRSEAAARAEPLTRNHSAAGRVIPPSPQSREGQDPAETIDGRTHGEWSVVDTWGAVEGVESDAAMSARVWGFLRPVAERHAGRTVLVVAHGGVVRTVMYGVPGIPADRPWRSALENTAVNLFEVEGGVWRLRMFGYEPGADSRE